MNDQLATRLLDVLRETNRHLEDIATTLEERRPYKPLILQLPGRDLNQAEFERLNIVIRDYFEAIEGKADEPST